MKIIAKGLGFVLTWLYSLVGSYGVALIILTVAVKIILYPVYAKQMKSTAQTAKLQPKVQEIQRQYANNKDLMNQKLQELYQKEGYNPSMGCLPMLVQMLIIIGLFTLLRTPTTFLSDEAMLYAIHEKFLWIPDMAQPDKWVLPIAAGLATYFGSAKNSAATAPGNGKAMGILMKYAFPVLILWMARSYPAGLALYWFLSNAIQVVYNMISERKKMLAEAEQIAKERAEQKQKDRQRERQKARQAAVAKAKNAK